MINNKPLKMNDKNFKKVGFGFFIMLLGKLSLNSTVWNYKFDKRLEFEMIRITLIWLFRKRNRDRF